MYRLNRFLFTNVCLQLCFLEKEKRNSWNLSQFENENTFRKRTTFIWKWKHLSKKSCIYLKMKTPFQKDLGQSSVTANHSSPTSVYYSCSSTIITLILAPNHSFSCNETLDSPWCCDPIFVPTQLKFSTSPLVQYIVESV